VNFDSIEIGHTVAIHRRVTPGDVAVFMALCGDINPIHKDDEAAKSAGYPRRIVHGMLVAAYTPALVGMLDVSAICAYNDFNWREPVFIGDELDITMVVVHKSRAVRVLETEIVAMNQDGVVVMTGEGNIVVPRID
jgi:acyl dehydratase